MADAVISFTIPDAFVTEAREAFQWELDLPDLATEADFTAWVRGKVKDVFLRYREVSAVQNVSRVDPTAD